MGRSSNIPIFCLNVRTDPNATHGLMTKSIIPPAFLPYNNRRRTMPLPSVKTYGAKQCSASSKRTKLPCDNPAAHGMRVCRMHGARRKETILKGEHHPKYKNGLHTKEAKADFAASMEKVKELGKLMKLLGMVN